MLIIRRKLFAKAANLKNKVMKLNKLQLNKSCISPSVDEKVDRSLRRQLSKGKRSLSEITGKNINTVDLGNGEYITSINKQRYSPQKPKTIDGEQLKITGRGKLDPGYFPDSGNRKLSNSGVGVIREREVLLPNGQVGEFKKTVLNDMTYTPGYEKSYQTVIPGLSRHELANKEISIHKPGTKFKPL